MPYTAPTIATLKLRYPAFAAVADPTLQYWIADSASGVDETWIEADYQPARLALAAHRMTLSGVAVPGSDVSGFAAAGVESFRSGAFSANFSADAVRIAVAGGLESTAYGREYLDLLRKNRGGPRVTASGAAGCCTGFNGFAGPLPPWHVC
jgi:hypothetical protein